MYWRWFPSIPTHHQSWLSREEKREVWPERWGAVVTSDGPSSGLFLSPPIEKTNRRDRVQIHDCTSGLHLARLEEICCERRYVYSDDWEWEGSFTLFMFGWYWMGNLFLISPSKQESGLSCYLESHCARVHAVFFPLYNWWADDI